MFPLSCGGFSLWVGLDEWLVKVFWLEKLASVFGWVGLDLFSMDCNEVSSSELWGVYGSGVALGSLSFNAQGFLLRYWGISVVCLALKLVGSWVELVFSVGMEAFG